MGKLKEVFGVLVLLVILCGSMAGITVSAETCGDFRYMDYGDNTVGIMEYTGDEENYSR